jgi:hypothetical protein
MPVGSFHDAFALRFYSHETWLHPPYLWTNVRTNRHCISTEIARMQLAQVTNKTEIVSAFRRLIYLRACIGDVRVSKLAQIAEKTT